MTGNSPRPLGGGLKISGHVEKCGVYPQSKIGEVTEIPKVQGKQQEKHYAVKQADSPAPSGNAGTQSRQKK